MSLPRIHARARVQAAALVDDGTRKARFKVDNLSVGGALLVGGPPFDVGMLVSVMLHLSDTEFLAVSAVVIRLEPRTGSDAAMAVRFVELSEHAVFRLREMVTQAYAAIGASVLAQVRVDLGRQGVTNLREVARAMQALMNRAEATVPIDVRATDCSTTSASLSSSHGAERPCTVWTRPSYLGLHREPRVLSRARQALERYGTSCAPAPAAGRCDLHHELERRVAAWFGKPTALAFASGLGTHTSTIPTLLGPQDLVLYDRDASPQVLEGTKHTSAEAVPYRHLDVEDLAAKLASRRHANVLVVVEAVSALSGRPAPLREICALRSRHRFYLYVDETHAIGVTGTGRGRCHELGVTHHVDFVTGGWTAGAGSSGGFVATDDVYRALLQATASHWVSEATPSPAATAAVLAALDEMEHHPEHVARLHENVRALREGIERAGLDLHGSVGPIVPLYVPDLQKLYELHARLYAEGEFTEVIAYPVVGINEGRLRLLVTAAHTRAQIDALVDRIGHHAHDLRLQSEPTPVGAV